MAAQSAQCMELRRLLRSCSQLNGAVEVLRGIPHSAQISVEESSAEIICSVHSTWIEQSGLVDSKNPRSDSKYVLAVSLGTPI